MNIKHYCSVLLYAFLRRLRVLRCVALALRRAERRGRSESERRHSEKFYVTVYSLS